MLDQIKFILPYSFSACMLYMLLDFDIKSKRNLYLAGTIIVLSFISSEFVLLGFGYEGLTSLSLILVHIPSYIACLFVSKYKGIKLVFVFLTVYVIVTAPVAGALIVSYFYHFNEIVLSTVKFLMYMPTGFLVYRYLRPTLLYMLRNTNKGWLGFCPIPLFYYAIVYLTYPYNETTLFTIVIMVLSLLLTLSSYLIILRFFKQAKEQIISHDEQTILMSQVAAAQLHFDALEKSQQKTMLYRHDMRHHLNLIGAYLADNNQEAAQKYISEIKKTMSDMTVEKYCNNYTVNLILYFYIANAKKEGIHVDTHIVIPEKALVSDMDLCVIFGNAIENAINACKNISEKNERFINITCKAKNNKLFIQIVNSYEGVLEFDDGIPISRKENHGLGTRSVVAIAQKYGGIYSFSAKDSQFNTSIIL